jgi:uncharacterized protein
MKATINKILYFPVTIMVLGISVCFLLFAGIQNFILKPIFYSFIQNKNIADPIIHCISLFVLLFSYYFFFRFYERREVKELSIKFLPGEMFGGFMIGFLTISLSIFILYLLGYYQVISISTSNYPIKLFTLLMVAALIEELFHRAVVIRICENWLGTNLTLLIAMLTELSHIFNPNSNLFSIFLYLIWGFTMAMLYLYTKRVWLPFFFHLGWNFAQPFYGSNLTGLEDMGSIIQSIFTGPELLTGGIVGIEGSIFTASFLLFIGITLYYLAKKEGKIVKSKLFKGKI